MLHSQAEFTLIAFCVQTAQQKKSQPMQALTDVLDSLLQLLSGDRCVKTSNKHFIFFVGMLCAHTHPQYQAKTALWFDHTMLKSSGVTATLPCTARGNRCAA